MNNTPATSRRRLLQFGAAALPLAAFGSALPTAARAATAPGGSTTLRMPAEEGRHVRTFMAWPALSSVWGNSLGAVRRDIANVAYAISRYEPVVMLARYGQAADARYLCGSGASYGIDVIEIANDDLWIRDFGPTFVVGPGAIAGVDTNFNGWGKAGTSYAQAFANDAVAAETLLGQYGVNRIQASFVGEGGSLETDGQGTLLATVSSMAWPTPSCSPPIPAGTSSSSTSTTSPPVAAESTAPPSRSPSYPRWSSPAREGPPGRSVGRRHNQPLTAQSRKGAGMTTKRGNPGGGLRAGSLSTFDSVVMAVAGCGPAYTVVALVPALVAAAGFASPAVLLYCAIPVLGIALALRHLGRLDVSSGATYSWVSRTLHPFLGFLSGWAVVVATTLFIIASTTPAGSATLSLFDEELAGNDALATAVGLGWFLLIAALVASGARVAARVRTIAVGTQLALLLTVAVTALTRDGHASAFSFSWFGFGHFDATHTFTAGALIASALYWGWDVTANLSEETRGGGGGSGLGGLIGLLVFAATLLTLTVASNVLLGPDAITSTDGGFLLQLGEAAWPGVGGTLLVLAVPLSMVATLETTLLQATRTLFAMGRDRTIPPSSGGSTSGTRPPWPPPWPSSRSR